MRSGLHSAQPFSPVGGFLGGEHDQLLPAAGLDPRFDFKAWRQPTQAIYHPLGSGDCIGFGRASTHCFAATLAGQPLGTGHDRGGVGDKQLLGPLNDRSNGALFGVASVAVPIGDSTLVARLRRGAGRNGSISLEVNGQPARTVEIPLMMMMISRFNSSTTTDPPRSRRGRQPR